MLTVGGYYGIFVLQGLHDTHSYGFLSYVQMQETPYLELGVHFGGLFFKLPDAHHLMKQTACVLPVDASFAFF
jgi:hypothetical protein